MQTKLLLSLAFVVPASLAFSTATPPSTQHSSTLGVSSEHWMDYLKFGGSQPTFNVLEKTQEFIADLSDADEWYDKDYVFRGPIIGPMSRDDVRAQAGTFKITDAFPDIDRGVFGYTIDPQNPYRCLFFERWTATNTGELELPFGQTLPPTLKKAETPIHVTSIVWTPEGKIIYLSIGGPVDRFEGNTGGVNAIFGLLKTAGVEFPFGLAIGSKGFILQQKIVQFIGLGKAWSENVPTWWKSKAMGAEPNDI
jgi:hypothetical protein